MSIITDMEAWLEVVAPIDFKDTYALYKAVKEQAKYGNFESESINKNDEWLIKAAGVPDKLLLATERAKRSFLSLLHCCYADPELDIEDWYHYCLNKTIPAIAC